MREQQEMTMQLLFPDLNDDVRYLLGKSRPKDMSAALAAAHCVPSISKHLVSYGGDALAAERKPADGSTSPIIGSRRLLLMIDGIEQSMSASGSLVGGGSTRGFAHRAAIERPLFSV